MKNLYLAILLLAFTANLTAFDKVWELQFASTPHHVHYTEGHKELIVGEGNTFKKYNAETGALIDSVVYSLSALKDYTIGEYHVTDDLKNLYVLYMIKDSLYNSYFEKFNIKNFNDSKLIFKQPSGRSINFNYGYTLPGSITQIANEKFIYSTSAKLYGSYVLFSGYSGIVKFIDNEYTDSINMQLNLIDVNSYNTNVLIYATQYYEYKSGPGKYSENFSSNILLFDSQSEPKLLTLKNLDLKEIVSVITTKSNLHKIYYCDSYGMISQYNFTYNQSRNLGFKINSLMPFTNDDEIILNNNGKLYHYNFKVNRYLDSIDLGPNNTYISDLNNNYLTSINESSITTYKSGANSNKVIGYLKDTMIIKSIGDTITLNAVSNYSPTKEEWDLGDGRNLTGDTIKLTYPKKGEYLVKYKGTYKDTVVNLTCKIKVLDTLALSFTHKAEMKQGYTELTITSEFSGDYNKVSYKVTPNKGKTDLAFVLIDSTSTKVSYKIFTSDIYNITVSLGNAIKTISKGIELIIPLNNLKNTDYSLLNMLNITNIVSFNENIYFQGIDYNYSIFIKDYIPNKNVYEIEFISTFNKLSSDYTSKFIANSKRIEHYSIELYEIESYLKKYAANKIFLSNNSLLFCSEYINKTYSKYTNTLYLIKDTMSLLQNHSIDIRGISNLSHTKYKNKYLLNTTNSNNNFYLVDTVELKGNQYNGQNLNLFINTSFSVMDTNIHMIAHNKNLCVYKLNSDFDILDTIASYPYFSSYSRAINGKYAYSLIDSSKNSKSKQLVSINIEKKSSTGFNLDSKINYHQVFQLNNDVSCLVGTKNDELIIQAFKDGDTLFKDFVIPIKEPFNIIAMTKDNELHLNYTTSGTISSYIRTKGFADIFKSLASSLPDDSTSNPIDTTKNKGIIQSAENQFGSVIQDPDFKAAKIYFKDSLDLSNSFVKIFTETGDEILTYSLSKEQKDLPIQTDKLYHGTYYVRLTKNGEEHNLGKFIIVR